MARSTPAQNPLGLANRTSMARILRRLSGAGRAQPVEDQQPRAHRDRGIRDVECPEVPAERVKVQKVQHVTERDPVPDVAERPSQPPASDRKLNAAPRLYASTRLKKPVISRTSPGRRLALIAYLLAWSATAMNAATASHGAMRFRAAGITRIAWA